MTPDLSAFLHWIGLLDLHEALWVYGPGYEVRANTALHRGGEPPF